MDILITVNNQKMHCNNTKKFVAGSQEFILFTFELSEEWDGLSVYAQFTQGNKSYNAYLDGNNGAYLPPEIVDGVCTLALKGSNGNRIAVTEPLKLEISPNPINGGASVTGVTLTLYEQLVNKVNSLLEDESVIVKTTERVLQEYLADDRFAAMSIGDHSIEVTKMSHEAIATPSEILDFLSF